MAKKASKKTVETITHDEAKRKTYPPPSISPCSDQTIPGQGR